MKFIEFIKDQDTNTIYKENKKKWLLDDNNNGYLSDKTKITYWRLFNSNVFNLEEVYNKDVRNFTSIEITNLIKSAITNSATTKKVLYSAINNYLVYCVERGHITYNQCDSIDTTEGLFEINAKAMKSNYMRLDEFYKYIDSLEASDVEKMVYVLVRYGCPAKHVPDVSWSDINEEEKILEVIVKDKLIRLEIDEEFIRRVRLAKACSGNLKGTRYNDLGYIIKSTTIKPIKINVIYGILERVAQASGKPRVDLGMLSKNRRLDLVQNVYDEFEEVNTLDLKDILDSLGISSTPTQINSFKKEVELILEIDVKKLTTAIPVEVIDTITGEIVRYDSARYLQDNSKETYGFYIDKSIISKTCKGERDGIKHLTFRYAE